MADKDFADFLARVRAGDEQAAADLVHRYESIIRREIRFRMTDPSVYRLVGDDDICQSVLASFFVRASLGQYDLNDPNQLKHLLLRMARNKLANTARRQYTQKRGGGQNVTEGIDELDLAATEASASRVAAGRELLEQVKLRLSGEERQLAELRSHGHDWAEIARQLGGSPDGRRMQLTRALNRVSAELGLEDEDG
jgi:RNA polymerase sigma-70 factor (ECF subfamily)